jgi:HSP20 family protein
VTRLSRIHADLDRLFDEVMRLASREPRAGEHEPPVDVVETEHHVVVLVEVPGIAREELDLAVEGRAVILTGVKRLRSPEGARRFHGVEREQGRFEHRVELLRPVNSHEGKARLADGVLTISFPKVEEKRTLRRPLEIEVIDETPETASEPTTAGDETT